MKQASQYIRQQLSKTYSSGEILQLISRIICHVRHLQNYQFLSDKDTQLSANERLQIEEITVRLLKHEPIQYILGETEFYGLPFMVDPWVLIPRPETEELVDWIIESKKQKMHPGRSRIMDACTGSGCIAIALAKHLPDAEIFGLDISEEALEVARTNAINNRVEASWISGDILSKTIPDIIPDQLDILASNPPYVTPPEKTDMEAKVLEFEPHLALFVPENRPLLFYEHLADIGLKKLKPGGELYVEINAGFGKETYELFRQKGYRNIEVKQDISGKDRMIRAEL